VLLNFVHINIKAQAQHNNLCGTLLVLSASYCINDATNKGTYTDLKAIHKNRKLKQQKQLNSLAYTIITLI